MPNTAAVLSIRPLSSAAAARPAFVKTVVESKRLS